MRVGIIGCGLIGHKRAQTLGSAQLVACADSDSLKAKQFAAQYSGIKTFNYWQQLVEDPEIDIVIIATPHHVLAEITLAAIQCNKHVLVEKPAARTSAELEMVLEASKKSRTQVRVGFNHRYHRALQQAKKIIDNHELGELMFVRGRYGHGGRIGYEKEWRANPAISGGGELIDQGVHLIDLARWFLGEFQSIEGFAHTYFWQMPVDDNSFLLLKNAKQQVAFLHVSCTEWKNLFSFEIYGQLGKIAIDGLGGSYGVERLAFYKNLPHMGPPETTIFEYPMADNSWELEFKEFMEDIKLSRISKPNLEDAYSALKITETIYKASYDSHS